MQRLGSQSMTPVVPFLANAPEGQTMTHFGSPHCRQSASSKDSSVAPGTIEMRLAPSLTSEQAVMHLLQPSQRFALKAIVSNAMPMITSTPRSSIGGPFPAAAQGKPPCSRTNRSVGGS